MPFDIVDVSFVHDKGTPFERKALENVSFSIEPGSFVGIAGNSGSGKTTLVKVLKGLLKLLYVAPVKAAFYNSGPILKILAALRLFSPFSLSCDRSGIWV